MKGETQIALPAGSHRLAAVLHTPEGPPRACLAMAYPLFEERKAAGRVFVETARALSRAGCAVLRFDYRGCGDSGGAFDAFNAGDWLEDLACAEAVARGRHADVPFGWLGLRLGTALIEHHLQTAAKPDLLILWQAVDDPVAWLSDALRKKLMKEMLTFGRSRASREALFAELDAGRCIDFDGYRITPALFKSLRALQPAGPATGAVATLQIHCGPGESPEAAADGAPVHIMRLPLKPFWNLIGFTDWNPLIQATVNWIAEQLEAPNAS